MSNTSSPTMHPKIKAAFEQHRLGKLEAAMKLCEEVLQEEPTHAEAMHLICLVEHSQGRGTSALAWVDRAITSNPQLSSCHCNRGVILKSLNRIGEAASAFEQAVKINPRYIKAWMNLGLIHQQNRAWEDSRACFQKAIELQPNHAQAHNNLGLAYKELKRASEAQKAFTRALELDPKFVSAYYNLGILLHETHKPMAAIQNYQKALLHKPDFAEAYSNMGLAFKEMRRHRRALYCFEQALKIRPDFANALANRGGVKVDLGDYTGAVLDCQQALDIESHHASAFSNLAVAQFRLGRFDEAKDNLQRCLALQPGHADAHFNLSIVQLLTGDYSSGFREYEWRWKKSSIQSRQRSFKQPLWLGDTDIRGKTILLHAEQGLGDTIQFCRYAKLVSDLGARVVMEVQPPLLSLLQGLEGVSQWVAKGEKLPPFDCHCPMMSLPLALGTTTESIPQSNPYLRPSSERMAHWSEQLGPPRQRRIGLVWSGNTTHVNDRNRSLSLKQLMSYLPEGAEYICLQKELRSEDQRTLAQMGKIRFFGDQLHDFSDTAALCSLMDLVISVDTSVAHLSAAIGVKTWIMLPMVPDWRWRLGLEETPWYQCARLLRQEAPSAWPDLLERIRTEITAFLGQATQIRPLFLAPAPNFKRVGVLTYANVGNFGDRLGMHVLSKIMPSHALVERLYFKPWTTSKGEFDLLIVGIGNSMFAPLLTPELFELLRRSKASIGIFGTQYRSAINEDNMRLLVSSLDAWYARYQQDLDLYATPSTPCIHLGDWLIQEFMLATPHRKNGTLRIGKEVLKNLPLDRVIQNIQEYPKVFSERLHPLLCALTSAREVAYQEQRESASDEVSGKFGSMLLDIFGSIPPEKQFWEVDKAKVVQYRQHVIEQTADLRHTIARLLT